MRFSFVQFCFLVILANQMYAGDVSAQELLSRHASISVRQMEVRAVLTKLEGIAHVKFVHSSRSLPIQRKVTLDIQDKPLSEILEALFRPDRISYQVVGGRIVLNPQSDTDKTKTDERKDAVLLNSAVDRTVTGVVRDDSGTPLPGVSVVLKGTTNVVGLRVL